MAFASPEAALSAFVPAAMLLTVTPGLDTALVLRASGARGVRPSILCALGISIGCLAWAALTAVGLAALLAASRPAFLVVRLAGALWLAWLGLGMLRPARKGAKPSLAAPDRRQPPVLVGLVTNLLNPKVGVFYVGFLPGFVPSGAPLAPFVLLLGAIHAGLGLVWLSILAAAASPLRRMRMSPRLPRLIDRGFGCLFIAFGLGLGGEALLEAPVRP